MNIYVNNINNIYLYSHYYFILLLIETLKNLVLIILLSTSQDYVKLNYLIFIELKSIVLRL